MVPASQWNRGGAVFQPLSNNVVWILITIYMHLDKPWPSGPFPRRPALRTWKCTKMLFGNLHFGGCLAILPEQMVVLQAHAVHLPLEMGAVGLTGDQLALDALEGGD